ncbi:arsenate reductase family protein [Marivirga sp.]|uniref:arsenate reductase family protein n=1 Tax=Marivirga sp. TaxID=2018662 RepID=UPI002D80F503|nr:ArsC/Spx/MgsR family protein [Marivirga sp.]HET8859747.1 ArsC/Spx/MgsR family protein [Marivirga sp.]
MGTKKKSDMEFKFIYNSTQIKEREAYGYAKSLDQHYINPIDLDNETITERQWAEIATKLNVSVQDLLDENNDYYKDKIEGKDFDDNDLLQLLKEHPQLIKTPIIVSDKTAKFIKSPFDFNEMDMAFEEIQNKFANKGESDG